MLIIEDVERLRNAMSEGRMKLKDPTTGTPGRKKRNRHDDKGLCVATIPIEKSNMWEVCGKKAVKVFSVCGEDFPACEQHRDAIENARESNR